jgi:hypothetical protein
MKFRHLLSTCDKITANNINSSITLIFKQSYNLSKERHTSFNPMRGLFLSWCIYKHYEVGRVACCAENTVA